MQKELRNEGVGNQEVAEIAVQPTNRGTTVVNLLLEGHLKYSFCKKLLLYKWDSEQKSMLPKILIFWIKRGFICTFSLSTSLSITLWTSKFTSSSRCNWTGISTVNSNGSWNDKHSCHFSTAKEISAKSAFFFM